MGPLEAIERLVGLQAQAPDPPYFGLWSRLEGFDPHDLGALVEQGRAVRIALMRSTLHLVSREDAARLRPAVQPAVDGSLRASYGKALEGVRRREVVEEARTLMAARSRVSSELGRVLARTMARPEPLGARQRRPRLDPPGADPAARRMGPQWKGRPSPARRLAGGAAGRRRSPGRPDRALPARVRTGERGRRPAVVRPCRPGRRARTPTATTAHLPCRDRSRALRRSRRSAARPRHTGTRALRRALRQPRARARRPDAHHGRAPPGGDGVPQRHGPGNRPPRRLRRRMVADEARAGKPGRSPSSPFATGRPRRKRTRARRESDCCAS